MSPRLGVVTLLVAFAVPAGADLCPSRPVVGRIPRLRAHVGEVATAITDSSYGGVVALWNQWGANQDEHHAWPMLGHDLGHAGFYAVAAPNRPTDLTVTADGSGNHLGWQDRSGVEDGYRVERSVSGAPWTWATIAMLPANAMAYDDPVVGSQQYRVRAIRIDPRSGRVVSSRPSMPAP